MIYQFYLFNISNIVENKFMKFSNLYHWELRNMQLNHFLAPWNHGQLHCNFIHRLSLKLGFVLEGTGTLNIKWYSSVGSVLESSCHQLSNEHWNFVIIMKNGSENWVLRDLPLFERFSWTKKWLWTPTLFKPNYLSSPWFKSKYLSAH